MTSISNAQAPTTRHLRSLTMDDSKVLGRSTALRKAKAVVMPQYQTKKFNTYNSNWTPMTHRASNEQIYKERRELVCNWFDLWTDSQRRRFLEVLFHHCRQKQLYFVQNWFNEHIPLKFVDPARVLPRFLTLYIFSYLDPRSLCRATMVCWHWKFLAEQDVLWEAKATRFGWFLPYTPSENEYGAWKKHYVACIKTLDMDVMGQRNGSGLYGTISDGTLRYRNGRKSIKLPPDIAQEIRESRPPWQPPDKNPKDLERSAKALFEECNPNDPKMDPALLLHTDKFGMPRKVAVRQSEPALKGLQAGLRNQTHRILMSAENSDLRPGFRSQPLSHSLDLESFEERRMMELMQMSWEPAKNMKIQRRPDLSGGGDYPLPWKHGGSKQAVSKSFPNQAHPRIIFISSRVPAADVLVDAVNFGIIPIVYEYEGTTLDSLMSRLDLCLQGRQAQSIGFFTHSDLPWELNLVNKSVVTVDNFDTPEFVEFFETVCTSVLPPSKDGHVDIFVPLASCDPGKEMLKQLSGLTGMQFSTPTGVTGKYNHIDSDWLCQPEGVAPPTHYFCESKLSLWASAADQVKEACRVTKSTIGHYFEQKHRDVVSQLVGQIVFDATGRVAIHNLDDISRALTNSLLALGEEQNVRNPLIYLGNHLLELAGQMPSTVPLSNMEKPMGGTLTPSATLSAKTLTAALQLDEPYEESLENSEQTTADEEGETVNGKSLKKRKNLDNQMLHDSEKEADEVEEELEEEIPEEIVEEGEKPVQAKKIPTPQKSDTLPWSTHSFEPIQTARSMGEVSTARGSKVAFQRPTKLMTQPVIDDQPEKRATIAKEILSSEVAYLRTLQSIKEVFFLPCKAALDSNRAVLSHQNMQIIFTDAMALMELSKSFVQDLRGRLDDWGPHQCLGDIFVKFSVNLKAYINFINNYPMILSTIEKSQEQSPLFRSLMKRREKTPASKMLTLAELMLAPARRIGEYVTLLTWFQSCTPSDHADKSDIAQAIKIYGRLEKFICECKQRCERERELLNIQAKIYACPVLLEANRFFVKQLDVARLKPPTDTVVPELRVYQHVESLGLFLFNDSLVVTRRTVKHFPFERSYEYNYKFDACAALSRLRVEDIPDSKFVKYAFRLFTPRRSWVCAADDFSAKFNWLTLVENTVKAALEEED